MNNIDVRYSVGALLYSPALNDKIASSILNGQFGKTYSVALCLEDTIADSAVGQALEQLGNTFKTLHLAFATHDVTLPKIFVRVRNPEQISVVYQKISCIQLKQKIDDMKDHVLNVRVGGNDFSNAFGVRRHIDETIYDILPVSQLLCDILTVFSRDYVVSGPVWEYYSSNNDEWAIGLKRELKYDVLNGFVGKTVIHPNQIPVVVDSLKVKKQDYDDAMEILSWRDDSALLVGGSAQKERMNEVNTHLRWAKRVASLAAVYGVQND